MSICENLLVFFSTIIFVRNKMLFRLELCQVVISKIINWLLILFLSTFPCIFYIDMYFIFLYFFPGLSATCHFPGAPAHSRVTFSDETLTDGTIASYECERGFELLGPTRRVCGANGKWTPDGIPFCGE